MRTCRTPLPLPLKVIHRDQIGTEGNKKGKKETKETIDQVDI
jgi:hypothetical protein